MEASSSGGPRPPHLMVGEDEALRQFFDGQDVTEVLESSVAVDTSILEQYLSNNFDPHTFMLPESPPDSSSEPCSPPQVSGTLGNRCSTTLKLNDRHETPDLLYQHSHWSTPGGGGGQGNAFQPMASHPAAPSSCRFKEPSPAPSAHCEPLTHAQLQSMGLTRTCSRGDSRQHHPQQHHQHHQHHHPHHQGTSSHTPQPYTAPSTTSTPSHHHPSTTSPPSHNPSTTSPPSQHHPSTSPLSHHHPSTSLPSHHHLPVRPRGHPPPPPPPPPPPTQSPAGGDGGPAAAAPAQSPVSSPTLAGTHNSVAPPHSDSPDQQHKRKRACPGEVGADTFCGDSDGGGAMGAGHLLTWLPHLPEQWHRLSDGSGQTLPAVAFHVETDKGFVYSPADEAFVCQKKNHFQVTVHVGVAGEPRYVAMGTGGAQPISCFQVNVFGAKQETSSQQVTIEQSQSDRSKRPFDPIRISLPGNKITKVTLGRLHFSETTANNMRKKGRPNPEQRYFQMVVGLYAATEQQGVLVAALHSERIIVRASNPGQFEMDSDTLWQRGALQEAVVCQGRVGINTDSPDEALVVCGNAKVMGTIMHPSDRRAKDNIQEVNSEDQLRRIAQMRIVEYDYKPEFAASMGIDHTHQTGIIAQEVRELLPTAVTEVGDLTCADGETIPHFLMVDKEQIFMENVGAVQQLCKLTDNLDARIKELEGWSGRLARLKSLTGSLRSKGKTTTTTTTTTTTHTSVPPTPPKNKSSHVMPVKQRVFKASVFTLLTTMALCVISITALYLLNLGAEQPGFPDDGGSSVFPIMTTTGSTTATSPAHWPPDVTFCNLLYCNQVFCCPLQASGGSDTNSTSVPGTEGPDVDSSLGDEDKQDLFEQLKNARDWTNTSIDTFIIKENQQVIDSRYLDIDSCGLGRVSFKVPISQYVPTNMRISLLMNSTELLVVHLCAVDESASCAALLDKDMVTGTRYAANTQGVHEWPLHVARLHHSSYHFRSTVAGQADCSTDRHSAGVFYTDYHFHFYRHCTD